MCPFECIHPSMRASPQRVRNALRLTPSHAGADLGYVGVPLWHQMVGPAVEAATDDLQETWTQQPA